jgi:hypothetical protein
LRELIDNLLFHPESFENFVGDGLAKLLAVVADSLVIAPLKFLEGNFFIIYGDGGIPTIHHIGAYTPEDKDQGNNQDKGLDNGGLRFVTEDLQHGDTLWKWLFLPGGGREGLFVMSSRWNNRTLPIEMARTA